MTTHISFWNKNKFIIITFLLLIMTAISGYLYNEVKKFNLLNSTLMSESNKLKNDLVNLSQKYNDTISLLDQNQKDKQAVVQSLNQIGLDYQNLLQNYNTKLTEVNALQKTVQIDSEILKKYSKYYFLNENYIPKSLATINKEFTSAGKEIKILMEISTRLEAMLRAGKGSGVPLFVQSGYRSFLEQKGLKGTYAQTFGLTKSNQFSADQGYSEHQLGTTVDITDGRLGLEQSFENTPSFRWLYDNAYLYGFVLSYPKGNKYYIYEPWHFRYVGLELAKYLHDQRKNFYDLDQKEIDVYKVKIFD